MPLLKAAIQHSGASVIDVISPCVAFNNHGGSTKSYDYVRDHNEALNRLDFLPTREEITVSIEDGQTVEVEQHDGSLLRLHKVSADYDPFDRINAMSYLQAQAAKGEIVTGLLFLDRGSVDLHHHMGTVNEPLNSLTEKELCPGMNNLDAINESLR